jgi:hypothetical protein
MALFSTAEDFALDASLAALYLAASLGAFRYCWDASTLDAPALRSLCVLAIFASLIASRAPVGAAGGAASGGGLGLAASLLLLCFCEGARPATYLWFVVGGALAGSVVGLTRSIAAPSPPAAGAA